MNDGYEVIWSETADFDLSEIIGYIADRNPLNAQTVFKKIKRIGSDLHISPEIERIVPELWNYGILQYRELIIAPWRIIYRIYRIAEKKVFVLSVIDGRRNVEDLLLNRMIRG